MRDNSEGKLIFPNPRGRSDFRECHARRSGSPRLRSHQRSQLGPKSARTILMASARLLWRISTNRRLRLPIGAGRGAVAAIVVHVLVAVLLN